MTKAEADDIRPQEPAAATRPEGRVRLREWWGSDAAVVLREWWGSDAAVVLREWRPSDAAVVLRAFQGCDLRDQASWPIVTLKDAEGWIASWRGAGHAFAVMDMTRGGLVVGNVAVTPVTPASAGPSEIENVAVTSVVPASEGPSEVGNVAVTPVALAFERPSEVGNLAVTPGGAFPGGVGMVSYWVVPEARGRGVATAAVLALVRWAFGERGMRRLELEHRTDNPASCRVATRAGFVADGVERGRLLRDGVRRDIEHHTLLSAAA
ncbi:GNAT family protein [Nonomuraea pusilla]|uniref:GNAT family N-acetyltransferase n=1 Tax=Nonomuraea pusilla TaxID=46177 RepID=UPI0033220D85